VSEKAIKKFGEVKDEINEKLEEALEKGKIQAEKINKTISHN